MSQLVGAHGHLICVEFPSTKDPKLGGPPFALRAPVYEIHLAQPGEEIPYLQSGHINEDSRKPADSAGLQRVARWQPDRTHEIGKGQDWVSIWTHIQHTDSST